MLTNTEIKYKIKQMKYRKSIEKKRDKINRKKE